MTDYISREAAIADIAMMAEDRRIRVDSYSGELIGEVISILRRIPAADVRPVVLCRDCQNSYEWANVDGDSYRYCGYLRSRWNHDTDKMVDDDDYCKWGRKKEES